LKNIECEMILQDIMIHLSDLLFVLPDNISIDNSEMIEMGVIYI